jgi:hypothetical protein
VFLTGILPGILAACLLALLLPELVLLALLPSRRAGAFIVVLLIVAFVGHANTPLQGPHRSGTSTGTRNAPALLFRLNKASRATVPTARRALRRTAGRKQKAAARRGSGLSFSQFLQA